MAELTEEQRLEALRRMESRRERLSGRVGDKAYLESLEIVQDQLDDSYERMKELDLKEDAQLKVLLASVEVSLVRSALQQMAEEALEVTNASVE